jgi:hypothetical protein
VVTVAVLLTLGNGGFCPVSGAVIAMPAALSPVLVKSPTSIKPSLFWSRIATAM